MEHYNIACVIGTRPEALKMIPLINCLQQHPQIKVDVIITGQHRELLTQILEQEGFFEFTNFSVMAENQTLNKLSSNLFHHFDEYFKKHAFNMVIAQGDTTTTCIAAMAAFHLKIPFAHIEAGLRTTAVNNPFPEEFNRRIATLAATLHFCPTEYAANNLYQEGIHNHVYVTGNTIIDMLYRYARDRVSIPFNGRKLILVTCHRRESFGEPLKKICAAILHLAEKHPYFDFLFPVHPNPNVKQIVIEKLSNVPNIDLTPPLTYQQLVDHLNASWLVLTDSGGIQEEAPALNKPVLVLRHETERPEAVVWGASRLVGTETNHIVEQVEQLLNTPEEYERMAHAGSPYGDGKAAPRITEIILDYLGIPVISNDYPRMEQYEYIGA
ncbi:MAG: UDP-N-acetylglucosamine 2-epimerase (non-hydrolyzing) [Legionella sp.]|nr:UDP-N-acetylglucosamine 2-epimerase (non-hydrolyzing) [Legionella sp.]